MKLKSFLFTTVFLALPVIAFAQDNPNSVVVPAIDPGSPQGSTYQNQPPTPPAPIPLINQTPVPLTAKERKGLSISQQYADRPEMPVAGDAGAVVFDFGATMPDLVCAPLFVCDIALQPGEVVDDVNIGDAIRWKVSPSISGDGTSKVTHVLIKPIDSGLRTDLIISTNQRVYTLSLVSTVHDYMPEVSFIYPEDTAKAWSDYHQKMITYQANTTMATGQNVASLDFGYQLSGDNPDWKPLRVYSDNVHTYIQMPPGVSSSDMPALVALGTGGWFSGPQQQVVNYRVQNGIFIVDKVLTKAELIAGVGSSQKKVVITHTGGTGPDATQTSSTQGDSP